MWTIFSWYFGIVGALVHVAFVVAILSYCGIEYSNQKHQQKMCERMRQEDRPDL